jgi:glycosyltransferase involved in cell wall biosynthesis
MSNDGTYPAKWTDAKLSLGNIVKKRHVPLATSDGALFSQALEHAAPRKALAGLKILHICETAKGGVATYLNTLFHIGKREGVQNVFIAPSRHSEFLEDGLAQVTYPSRSRGILPTLRLLWSSFRTARRFQPDIIFAHSSFTLPILALLRISGVRSRFVYCAHGWAALQYTRGSLPFRITTAIERYLPKLAHSVICISAKEREFAWENGYRGNFIVIENCVMEARDTARSNVFAAPGDPRIHLLFVGRFDTQKGLDILHEGFAEALKKRKDIVLHLVGGSVRDEPAEDLVSDSRHIVRHGWVGNAEIDSYFRSADAIVVPSRWEAFGLVVAEAFRNGTPALVSDRGALPSFVEEGKSGHVFKLTPESIAEILGSLSKHRLQDMRENARLSYERRYTVEIFKKKIEQLYLALAD